MVLLPTRLFTSDTKIQRYNVGGCRELKILSIAVIIEVKDC